MLPDARGADTELNLELEDQTMDSRFERNYQEALQERLQTALEALGRGDLSALQRLEDAITAQQAQRFGIPKSSITKLWTLEGTALVARKTLALGHAS
jgi:hypothetical protein